MQAECLVGSRLKCNRQGARKSLGYLITLVWVSASILCTKALEGFVSEEPHHLSPPPKPLSINLTVINMARQPMWPMLSEVPHGCLMGRFYCVPRSQLLY